MNAFITACGEWFPTAKEGLDHELHCEECAQVIAEEDEGYGCYDWEDED